MKTWTEIPQKPLSGGVFGVIEPDSAPGCVPCLRVIRTEDKLPMELLVSNRPCPPLRGFIGMQIWSRGNDLMNEDVKIADRIGYSNIILIEKSP